MTWGNPPKFKGARQKRSKAVTPENLSTGSESAEQSALMAWAALNVVKYPQLKWLAHIPNGGSRDIREAVALKAQGVKAGIPDLILPVQMNGAGALFIEMKRKGGVVSSAQKEWLAYLESAGYIAVVCYSWQSAAEVIERYLKGEM